jgi:PD-(D/E)XK nuclease superfamily
VVSLDLIECDAGATSVVDLKTSARKYIDLQVEASLQLSVYSYATATNGLADQEDLRLRFDVLTKTKQPELYRYWTQRDRAANLRLLRLAAEVLHACFIRIRAGSAQTASSGASAGPGVGEMGSGPPSTTAAAVIGKNVPFTLLVAIADVPENSLRRALTHLQAADFVYETTLFPDLEYTFKHALTHDVAYSSMLQERRRARHSSTRTLCVSRDRVGSAAGSK